jgi:putative SOS response-associated peptidase YedK
MCGRFTLKSNLADWVGTLFDQVIADLPAQITPAHNIAPTQSIHIIHHDDSPTNTLRCQQASWGLLPVWVKSKADGAKLINARSETIFEKPTFKKIIHTQRCLIPTDGYFEWQVRAGAAKQPYLIHRADGSPFFFAGLWQINRSLQGNDKPILSATILTTAADETFAKIHGRMPLMLMDKDRTDFWMRNDAMNEHEFASFAVPPNANELTATPVTTIAPPKLNVIIRPEP